MDNLRSVIELLYTRDNINDLFWSLVELRDVEEDRGEEEIIGREDFKNLFFSKHTHYYSGNQLNSLFDITNDTWSDNRIIEPENGKRNVFNVLTHLTHELLIAKGGVPYCKYEEYLRWHKVTELIGEDMLVTSFLASSDFNERIERADFAWAPNLVSDSDDLHYLMTKGMAELHNHLYGSSLVFTLNWLALMNLPEKYTSDQCKRLYNLEDGYRKLLLAAFIRSVLYKCVNECIYDSTIEAQVNNWLRQDDKLEYVRLIRSEVQSYINRLRCDKRNCIDYAIPSTRPVNNQELESRISLTGERKFLYQCFYKIYEGGSNPVFDTMFYIYLIIKSQFRCAMIQVNDIMGFENFQRFERNKWLFLDSEAYTKALSYAAHNLALQHSNIKHIEYRVSPKETAAKLYASLDELKPFTKDIRGVEYGYILHFLKRKEPVEKFRGTAEEGLVRRNNTVRVKTALEANSIKFLVEHGNKQIIGIDAASSEFDCRPEVFATVYRKLKYIHLQNDIEYLKNVRPVKLGYTYHVGEDFYDVVDGLRAMDEALIFLNLRNGDRIGHGTALGIDVFHYYDEKHFTVVMPKQVLFDNMVWLLNKMEKYGLQQEIVYGEIRDKFNSLRSELYNSHYDESLFYKAWLLRGDEPELYLDTRNELTRHNVLEPYKLNDVNIVNDARRDSKARELYYHYHYDYEVKHKGSKSQEWKVEAIHRASFVRVINKIQRQMQEEIAYKHIAIECNPTSNLRIGNIQRYVEHPIVRFNNDGLQLTNENIESAAQISVSINTDDAGIFATSLEKEFTLMAIALEKERDPEGRPKYQQNSVYTWLEKIRENAFKQKFESFNQNIEQNQNIPHQDEQEWWM